MTAARKSQPAKTQESTLDAPERSRECRTPTKTDQMLAMLKAPDGASIEELSNSFGWLQHTARAALTGLRKKGHTIVRAKRDNVTVYRVSE